MPSRSARNKNRTRPIKRDREKRRRIKVQRRRLLALGVPEEKVMRLDVRQIRALLRHPARLKK
jgi:hypothetical protein